MALPQLNSARYEITIPSQGRSVSYRPYLVKEEKILMVALESQDQSMIMRAIKDVIEQCVYDDIDVNKLAVFDIETLFLALRAKSVGENMDLKIKCTECESLVDVSVNVDDIEIPQINTDNVVMLTETIGVTLRYPSFEMVSNIGDDVDTVDGAFKMIADCIDTIFEDDAVHNASDISKKEMDEFLENLNSEQFKKMSTYFEDMPSLKHDLTYTCQSCTKTNNMELKGLQSFFT